MTTDPVQVHQYPKSSCPCENCPTFSCEGVVPPFFVERESEGAVPTSLGLANCYKSPGFNCWDKKLYDSDEQPKLETKLNNVKVLNKFGLTFSPGFKEVKCDNPIDCDCKGVTYISHDPRLLDVPRNIWTKLDRPSLESDVLQGNVPRDEIYSEKYRNYGKKYGSYQDINAGQIVYYIDESIAPAYFYPNYTLRSAVDHVLFVDPMGAVKPQYVRKPFVQYNSQRKENLDLDTDDFTEATVWFREDLMARQQRKHNQEKYSARWEYNDCYLQTPVTPRLKGY